MAYLIEELAKFKAVFPDRQPGSRTEDLVHVTAEEASPLANPP